MGALAKQDVSRNFRRLLVNKSWTDAHVIQTVDDTGYPWLLDCHQLALCTAYARQRSPSSDSTHLHALLSMALAQDSPQSLRGRHSHRNNFLIHTLYLRQVCVHAFSVAIQRRKNVHHSCVQEYDNCLELVEETIKESQGAAEYPLYVKALIYRQQGNGLHLLVADQNQTHDTAPCSRQSF